MNRRARLGTGAVLTACLLAAALPAAAQQPRARVPFEGSHAFRHILKLHKLQPRASAAEFATVPAAEAVLMIFGDPAGIDEAARHLGGLSQFRGRGGAILIATDRPDETRLSVFGSEFRRARASAANGCSRPLRAPCSHQISRSECSSASA